MMTGSSTSPAVSLVPTIPLWMLAAIAVALAALVGWIDFNADEVQPAVLLLFVFGATLAYLDPRRAWLVALVLGLSIAGTHVVASTMGLQPATPAGSPFATLLALIPAALGAAFGGVARYTFSRSRNR